MPMALGASCCLEEDRPCPGHADSTDKAGSQAGQGCDYSQQRVTRSLKITHLGAGAAQGCLGEPEARSEEVQKYRWEG